MNIICVYAKPPVPGRTKTRLAAAVGDDVAAGLAAAMLGDLVDEAARTPGVEVQVWYPPGEDPGRFAGVVPVGTVLHPQRGADLGERMCQTFEELVAGGGHRVLLVGSDCVTFTAELFGIGFGMLARLPVVLQPAADGGYVLVGQSTWCPEMFRDVPWGSDEVLARTWTRLRECGVRCGEMVATWDVDTADDLWHLAGLEAEAHPRVAAWVAAHQEVIERHRPR